MALSVKMFLSVMRPCLLVVYARGLGMWPGEDATSWRNDAASDCLALPVLFRKYQSPPTQSPRSPVDANVPLVACRIWGMLFEILSLQTDSPGRPQVFRCIMTEKDTVLRQQRMAAELFSLRVSNLRRLELKILFVSHSHSLSRRNRIILEFRLGLHL